MTDPLVAELRKFAEKYEGGRVGELLAQAAKELDRLGKYHAELAALKDRIEEIAAATDDEWKASGLEATATMLRMWHIEGVQEMKQELRRLKDSA